MNNATELELKRATAQIADLVAAGRVPANKRTHLEDMAWQALFLMEKHGLRPGEWDGWSFKWDRSARQAGYANWEKKVLSLSAPIFAASSEDMNLETILHEIAHALEPGHRRNIHTAAWYAKAREIGSTGEVYYDENSLLEPPAGAKWEGVCPDWHTTYRVKPPGAGRTYRCPKDKGVFAWYEL